jgi:hypothetical protein
MFTYVLLDFPHVFHLFVLLFPSFSFIFQIFPQCFHHFPQFVHLFSPFLPPSLRIFRRVSDVRRSQAGDALLVASVASWCGGAVVPCTEKR